MSPDVAASIRARLLNRAKETRQEFELFLVRYACERILYRLGASALRDRCILKGAGLLALWMDDPYRATRDLDLLAHGPSDETSIRNLVTAICETPCPEDGLTFDLESLDISAIRAEEEYEGQRVVLREPEETEYPTLLRGLPVPRLRTYPREASVAEKFEAVVQLGRRNSRMKDFHDLWALSSVFAFEGSMRRRSVVATFEHRRTAWTDEPPDALEPAFYIDADLESRWGAYVRASAFRSPPPTGFVSIGGRVRQFLGPLRESVVAGEPFEMRWNPGGPWR